MFLAARATLPAGTLPAATIIGVPYDRTASHRPGARFAPGAIRWASQSIESYSAALDRDLEDLPLLDAGDLPVEGLPPEAMVELVERTVRDAAGWPVLLGGEHTVSLGAVRALAARHPDLHVVVLDAHLDLRAEYGGTRWSHAATVRRLADVVGPGHIVLLGVRSGTREEFVEAKRLLAAEGHLRLEREVWARLDGRPLYLSIDVDVVDPSAAPGTGNPEPGGPSARDLFDLLRVLSPLRVIGLDVVEVSPTYDPSGQTATLAAMAIREAILTWAAPAP